MTDWTTKTGTELVAAILAKEVTSVAILEALLERIKRLDAKYVNAVVLLYEESARARAKEADAALAKGVVWGPLHGVPMTIKECNIWANTQMTNGVPSALDGIDSTEGGYNEPFVQRLLDAGAILFGKTNLPKHLADWQSFNEIYGQTNNPFDFSKTPGGSSGGGSAAVAAMFTPLEMGSDIGGSIRIPASFCGVFGHKPTYAAIDRCGVTTRAGLQDLKLAKLMSPSDISVRGPLARSADDLKLLMEVTTGSAVELPPPQKTNLTQFKVALISTLKTCPVSKETQEAVTTLAQKLEAVGATVALDADVKLPFDPDEMFRLYLKLKGVATGLAQPAITACDALGMDGKTVQSILKSNAAKYEDSDDSYEALAARVPFISYGEWKLADTRRHQLRVAWRDFFGEYDILVCPIFSRCAFEHDHSDPAGIRNPGISAGWQKTISVDGVKTPYLRHMFWSGFTNTCYLPSTAFPSGLGEDSKLPIGLQAVGAEGADYLCIEFARLLETELNYGFQRPKNMLGDE